MRRDSIFAGVPEPLAVTVYWRNQTHKTRLYNFSHIDRTRSSYIVGGIATRLPLAADRYLDRRGMPAYPDDLVRHDCVSSAISLRARRYAGPLWSAGEQLAIEAGIFTDLSDAVATISEAVGEINISPNCVAASDIRRGALVPVLPGFAVEHSVVAALWPESRRDSPNVRAFLPRLDETLPSPRLWDDVCSGDSRASR